MSQELDKLLLVRKFVTDLWKFGENISEEVEDTAKYTIFIPRGLLHDVSFLDNSHELFCKIEWAFYMLEVRLDFTGRSLKNPIN